MIAFLCLFLAVPLTDPAPDADLSGVHECETYAIEFVRVTRTAYVVTWRGRVGTAAVIGPGRYCLTLQIVAGSRPLTWTAEFVGGHLVPTQPDLPSIRLFSPPPKPTRLKC